MSRTPAPRFDDVLRWRARFAARHAAWVAALAVVVSASGWFDPAIVAFCAVPVTLVALLLAHDRRDLGLSHGELAADGAVVRIAKGGMMLSRGLGVLRPGSGSLELTATRADPLPRAIQLLTIVGGVLSVIAFDPFTAVVFVVTAFAVSALVLSFADRETVDLHPGTVRDAVLSGVELRFGLQNPSGRYDALVLFLHGLDRRRVEPWLRTALDGEVRVGVDRAPAGSGTALEARQLDERLRELRAARTSS